MVRQKERKFHLSVIKVFNFHKTSKKLITFTDVNRLTQPLISHYLNTSNIERERERERDREGGKAGSGGG
jgi:hypothetical protein